MPTLINTQEVLDNSWIEGNQNSLTSSESEQASSENRHILLDWQSWCDLEKPLNLPEKVQVGVVLPNTEEPESLAPYFEQLQLIALSFPAFTDGRAYSQARMLRELGYTGELRATGDVLPDQLYYMARCGINTFLLKEGKTPDTALKCLKAFTVAYQAAADDRQPVYRT